jgi:hypothetical protein
MTSTASDPAFSAYASGLGRGTRRERGLTC